MIFTSNSEEKITGTICSKSLHVKEHTIAQKKRISTRYFMLTKVRLRKDIYTKGLNIVTSELIGTKKHGRLIFNRRGYELKCVNMPARWPQFKKWRIIESGQSWLML